MNYTITPAYQIRGRIVVGGDKSISHRALMIGAIAKGITTITGISTSADVQSTENCLRQLGVSTKRQLSTVTVNGVGLKGFQKPDRHLDAGNSGTTMRLLCGLLAGQDFSSTVTGDDSLKKRPMARIIKPLRRMGAQIYGTGDDRAPVTLTGSQLFPTHYQSPVASAQVKSSILLAGLYADGRTSVSEPFQSRDHTERMLADFAVDVRVKDLTVTVSGESPPRSTAITVPGDISSAAFFIAAATLLPDSQLMIENVGLNPTRTGFLEVLREMGAQIMIDEYPLTQCEPIGDITIYSSDLKGITINENRIPSLIDELPILAVIAARAKGRTEVSGASELRVKESDRLRATTENLRAMGVEVEEKEDGFIIEGPQPFKGAAIETYQDHRIAMAFSIAGLLAREHSLIKNSECISISMPQFFEILESIKKS